MDEWIPKGRELEGEEALSELTLRYFKGHGPATEYDFATWSGMKVSDARRGIELVHSCLEHVKINERTHWFSGQDVIHVPDSLSERIWLLPAFDEMLCGYKDKSLILKTEHVKSAILKNGIICPIILVDGKTIGTWRRELKKENMVFSTQYFNKPTKSVENAVRLKAEQIGEFLSKKTVFA